MSPWLVFILGSTLGMVCWLCWQVAILQREVAQLRRLVWVLVRGPVYPDEEDGRER